MKKTLVKHIASTLLAYNNCVHASKVRPGVGHSGEYQIRHENSIHFLVKDFMPSGSGIDTGTKFDWEASTPDKLVFTTAFHHMNGAGFYDGWTEHKVIVTPSLVFDYDLKVTGLDRNEIKDYLAEVFGSALDTVLEQTAEGFLAVKD